MQKEICSNAKIEPLEVDSQFTLEGRGGKTYSCTVTSLNKAADQASYWVYVSELQKHMLLNIIDWCAFHSNIDIASKQTVLLQLLRISGGNFLSVESFGAAKAVKDRPLKFRYGVCEFSVMEYPYLLLHAPHLQYSFIASVDKYPHAKALISFTQQQMDSVFIQLVSTIDQFQKENGLLESLTLNDIFFDINNDEEITLRLALPGFIYFAGNLSDCSQTKINLTGGFNWWNYTNLLHMKRILDSEGNAMHQLISWVMISIMYASRKKKLLWGMPTIHNDVLKGYEELVDEDFANRGCWLNDIQQTLTKRLYDE